ncbi:hypothetical protein GOBAR_DD22327 [Gossypium barbadense]|nr:hypothetical protein GOBAR_DD22327 [Gossypium barbadense]
MGVQVEIEFPIIEFRPSDLKRGTDGWHRLCKRVREACETFGCFEVVYEKISAKAREETFGLMKELVEVSMLYEGFGLGDTSNYDSVKSFAQLMWPDGYPHFCTIIYDDQVLGLEIEVNGQWIKLSLSPSSFCFVVGDPLKAWSNGRLKAVNHRVMISGDKDRFSIATFAIPVEAKHIDSGEQLQAFASLSPPVFN